MGFLDSLLGGKRADSEEAPKPSGIPLKVVISFAPVRLSAMKENSVRLIVKITNVAHDEQLASVDALLPRNALLGFDPTCIHKHHEKRVGKIGPGESVEAAIPIYGTNQTKEGNYPYKVIVYSHYLDYDKVLSKVERKGVLRVA